MFGQRRKALPPSVPVDGAPGTLHAPLGGKVLRGGDGRIGVDCGHGASFALIVAGPASAARPHY
jgi:hypothetical protein